MYRVRLRGPSEIGSVEGGDIVGHEAGWTEAAISIPPGEVDWGTKDLSVTPGQRPSGSARVTRAPFGRLPDGSAVEQFTLTNGRGMEVRTIPYGAIITSIRVPDRNGQQADVTLGFDSL